MTPEEKGYGPYTISTHAPAGGATRAQLVGFPRRDGTFLLTPLREGRRTDGTEKTAAVNFYSRPCGRGDTQEAVGLAELVGFLLTPLREGRPGLLKRAKAALEFLLTPLREGRPARKSGGQNDADLYFYSRPCGRGDVGSQHAKRRRHISTHAPAGGATQRNQNKNQSNAHFYSRPCGRGDSNFPQVRHEVLRQIAER